MCEAKKLRLQQDKVQNLTTIFRVIDRQNPQSTTFEKFAKSLYLQYNMGMLHSYGYSNRKGKVSAHEFRIDH